MSVNVLLELQSLPEMMGQLTAALEDALVDTRKYEGCVSVQVLVNQDDPLNLILSEVWGSREHNEKYLAWRTATGVFDALGSMLSQPPSFRYYDTVSI